MAARLMLSIGLAACAASGQSLSQINIIPIQREAYETYLPLQGTNSAHFLVTRTGPTNENLIVKLTSSSQSASTNDYSATTSVGIKAGQTSAEAWLTAIPDNTSETNETVDISIAPASDYTIGTNSTATAILKDSFTPSPGVIYANLIHRSVYPFLTVSQGEMPLWVAAYSVDNPAVKAEVYDNNALVLQQSFLPSLTQTQMLCLEWKNATVGKHQIEVRLFDQLGRSFSTGVTDFQITTKAPNPPSVVFNNPPVQGEVHAGVPFTLTALASDYDGFVQYVEFYDGTQRVGFSTNAGLYASPTNRYSARLTLPAGHHVLQARAMDEEFWTRLTPPLEIDVDVPVTTNKSTISMSSPTYMGEVNASNTVWMVARTDDAGTPMNVALYKMDFDVIEWIGNSLSNSPSPFPVDPRIKTIIWTNAPRGPFLIYAKGTNSANKEVVSALSAINLYSDGRSNIVSVAATDAEASEYSSGQTNTAIFTLSRTGQISAPLTVSYTLSGTAANGADYLALPETVYFMPGQVSTNLVIQPLADSLLETNETVIITLRESWAYQIQTGMGQATASLVDAITPSNRAPSVTLLSPTNNTTITLPVTVTIRASINEVDGTVNQLRLWDGTNLVSQRIAAISGSETVQFYWTNPPAGEHLVKVSARDNAGATTYSDAIRLFVQSGTNMVTTNYVSVVASDAEAAERSSGATNTGLFLIKRSGQTNQSLQVNFQLSGTASNGIDYSPLPTNVLFKPGQVSTNLTVHPLDDSISEPTETVILTLKPSSTYQIQPDFKQATVFLKESTLATNLPPSVVIKSPTNETYVLRPTNLVLTAEVQELDGKVNSVYFRDGTNVIGHVIASISGTQSVSMIWTNPPVGEHSITASARDNASTTTYSEPIQLVVVTNINEMPFVGRQLPNSYTPGSFFQVMLIAMPRSTNDVYAVEDTPPDGSIVEISANGSYDAINKKVKFGPFLDGYARMLTYRIRLNTNAPTKVFFTGRGSLNGYVSPIVGMKSISTQGTHPADLTPCDQRIALNEVTAYGRAWRMNQTWPLDPNPIPMTYVTSAGMLWKKGEYYRFATNDLTPPACWANYDPYQSNNLAGDRDAMSDATTARRTAPRMCSTDEWATIQIAVTPTAATSAYAVEETIPLDCEVSNVNADGQYDAERHHIKWGPFMNAQPRTLTYQIKPASGRHGWLSFAGRISFDGRDQAVQGTQATAIRSELAWTAPARILAPHDNGTQVTFIADGEQEYVIERSADLIQWQEIKRATPENGVLAMVDSEGKNLPTAYYRARPANPVLRNALTALFNHLGAAPKDATVVGFQKMAWNDASMGCPEPGKTYTQSTVYGYRLIVLVDGERYEIHTDLEGSTFILSISGSQTTDGISGKVLKL